MAVISPTVIGIIFGAIIAWSIAEKYYKRSNIDQSILYNKLTEDLRKIILADKRDLLTIKELNDILKERVIDGQSLNRFPFKLCPKCGSENICRDTDVIVDYDRGDGGEPVPSATSYEIVGCNDCGWRRTELDGDEGNIV